MMSSADRQMLWLDSVPAWPAIGLLLSPAAVSAEQWHKRMRPVLDEWLAAGGQLQILRQGDLDVSFVDQKSALDFHFDHHRCWVRSIPRTESSGQAQPVPLGAPSSFSESQAAVLSSVSQMLDLVALEGSRKVQRIGIVASGMALADNPPPGVADWIAQAAGGDPGLIDKLDLAVSRRLASGAERVEVRYGLQLQVKPRSIAFSVDWQWFPQAGAEPELTPKKAATLGAQIERLVHRANSQFQLFAEEGLNAGVSHG